jgi:hypothetical protein
MTVDRIDKLVALSIKNLQHPYHNSFPAFIRKILASEGISTVIALGEIKTLNVAFRSDKWANLIKNNSYQITPQEVETWERNYKAESYII